TGNSLSACCSFTVPPGITVPVNWFFQAPEGISRVVDPQELFSDRTSRGAFQRPIASDASKCLRTGAARFQCLANDPHFRKAFLFAFPDLCRCQKINFTQQTPPEIVIDRPPIIRIDKA